MVYIFFIALFIYLKWTHSISQAVEQWHRSWLTATSADQVQAILLPQPPKELGLQVHAITPVF